MTVAELLARLERMGVEVDAAGDELRIRAERGVLDDALKASISAQKPALLRMLHTRRAERDAPIPRAPRDAPLPLSEFQERLWLMNQLEPESTVHQFGVIWSFPGVGQETLTAAIRDLARRHEILRSTFRDRDGEPVVEIGATQSVPIKVVDVAVDAQAQRRLSDEALSAELHTPFDLTTAPPVRFVVLSNGNLGSALVVSIHHIAADDWSLALLHSELEESLASPGRPAPNLQFADYAAARRRPARMKAALAEIDWWEQRLAGAPELCIFLPDLPGDPAAPAAAIPFSLDLELTRALGEVIRREGVTMAMAAYAAYAVVLRAHTGLDDIVFGVPLGVRERPELETMVGPFVNLVVLRIDLADDPSFTVLLRRVRDIFLDAYAHRDAPFEQVVQRLNPNRSFLHGPIFQSAVVVHNATGEAGPEVHSGGAMHEVTWYLREDEGRLQGSFEYRADLYRPESMQMVTERLVRVFAEAVAEPGKPVSRFGLLTEDERRRVLETFNDTAVDLDGGPVPQMFDDQVRRTPTAVALTFDGRDVTYAELAARAGALARAVRAAGAGRGSRVGVCLQRSPGMVAALLGVQAAGAAYVPLDPNFPAERLAFMVEDSRVAAIITDEDSRDRLPTSDAPVLDIGALEDSGGPEPSQATADQLAYVIYTSGSTGRPNGVAVSHGALSNFLQSMLREPGLGPSDVLAAVTTISFDIAGLELYLPLMVGARLELVPSEIAADGEALAEHLERSGATVMQATPATWRLLIEADWPGSPQFRALVGGEALPPDLAAALLPRVESLWNLYGPTETTIWSTVGQVRAEDQRITIGRPIANTRVYVLDAEMKPTPIGLPGELWIGGAGLAEGYHERPDLTVERFRPDPFAGPGARMYRTGDLGRWIFDGRLAHLGRRDHQVKVRGFRIELGEIEGALMQHPAVRHAVVTATDSGSAALVAYTIFEDGEDPTVSELRRFLRARLPDYMTPAIYVSLEALPLTPNGKVDRKALPDPFTRGRRARRSNEPLKPGVEQILAEVWRELLQAEDIGPDDNFFELGGHSLLALRASNAVARRAGWRLEPRALFFQTLREVAKGATREPAGALT